MVSRQALDLPDVITELFERHGRCEVVNVVQELDSDQARVEKLAYGVCTVLTTGEGEYVLVRLHDSFSTTGKSWYGASVARFVSATRTPNRQSASRTTFPSSTFFTFRA